MSEVLGKLVSHLNAFLRCSEFDERAINGLQVAGKREVRKIAFAVDGVLETFEKAAEADADLLIVHHGIFWGHQFPLRGPNYKKIKVLMDHELALYAVHLPLDAHPEVGHNAVLLRALGCDPDSLEPFGTYHGQTIGFRGRVPDTDRDAFTARLEAVLGGPVRLIGFGPEKVRNVSCITGAGADFATVSQAKIGGIHYHISGEADHPIYHFCRENGVNLGLGGHYNTEVFGLHALRAHLDREFGLESCFIDCPTGL